MHKTVDRRFDRTSYDQARTVERFGEEVRRLVDPGSVDVRLLATVQSTLQPAGVSLWTKEPL